MAKTCLDCQVLPPFSLVLCPLHAAAEAMQAILTELINNEPLVPRTDARLRALIAQARLTLARINGAR